MPFPDSPPPLDEAGAITQPRQLQRWLDVNPVHALRRTQSYITLPSFSVESQWKGYSEIVGIFNYASSNNFSLKRITPPTSPNYVACIMWVDSLYNVYRYRLWEDVGEVFFFDAPLYTNQKVGKNFRIEIWNVEPAYDALTTFTLTGSDTVGVNSTYVYNIGTGAWNGSTYNALLLVGGQWSIVYTAKLIVSPLTTSPVGTWSFIAGAGTAPFGTIATTCSQTAALTFYTSKLGNYDYRYAIDFSLGTPSTIVTALSVALPANLPIQWPVNSYPIINL